VACEVLVGTRAVKNQIRCGTDLQLRSTIMAGGGVGMQTMSSSLDSLLFDGVISEGVYQSVMKNYPSNSG
jgi:Tfp pilus assembly pilus retraction ATPase PilT